jgi:hypothetical protein
MPMSVEQIEKLAREMPATELKRGAVYVVTYDINKIPRNEAMKAVNWMQNELGVNAYLMGYDGFDGSDAVSFYKMKEDASATNDGNP